MIQRIQTVYLLLACIAMVVCALFSFSNLAAGIAALVPAVISLYDISLYKNRPLQANICRGLCLFGIAFIIFLTVSHTGDNAEKNFLISMCSTVLAVFLWFLASKAIIKDEKLVRSLDRIR